MSVVDLFRKSRAHSEPVVALRSAAEPPADPVHAVRVLSDLLSRAGLARRAGKTFGGKRDLYEALGYARELRVEDFRDRYERGDVAGRIVDTYPKETWRDGPELVEDEDPETVTVWEQAFLDFAKRTRLWHVMKRADILSGLGPYSVILIGAAGQLETELPKMQNLDGVLYLTPYAADDAQISTWETESESPRFGLPRTYRLSRKGTMGMTTLDREVHWTRIIHIADNLLDDRVSGRPLLARVWNRLDDLDKVVGGGSEAFWLRVNGGTIFSVDKDVKVEEGKLDQLKTQAEEFAHGLRRTLAARGFTATQLDSDVSNFGNQVDAIMGLISGATSIPQRILLGSERGELASSQDKRAWDDRISERRTDFAEPVIEQLVERLTTYGAMKAVKKYDVRWPDFEELDQVQKAEVADKWAQLNEKAGGVVVTPAEIRDRVLGLDALEEADLERDGLDLDEPPEDEPEDDPPPPEDEPE